MKKFKSVLAFGDSHVAGCEILGSQLVKEYLTGNGPLEEMDSQTKPFSFPNQLADMLKIPCYNYALSGGSNERSLRLPAQHVMDMNPIHIRRVSQDLNPNDIPEDPTHLQ